MAIIHCDSQSDIPKCDHWAIIGFSSVFTRGEHKHAPDVCVPVFKYTAYTNLDEWEEAINKLVHSNDMHKYTALKIIVPKIDITVKVSIQ